MTPAPTAVEVRPLPLPLWAASALLLFVAAADLPYGYYQFLRLATCGAAVYMAWRLLSVRANDPEGWGLAAICVLYNPLFPVHLERSIWVWVNIATAAAFIVIGLRSRRSRRT